MRTNNFNLIYACLFLLGLINICRNSNYMVLYYRKGIQYITPFNKNATFNHRNNINAIKIGDTKVNQDEPFTISDPKNALTIEFSVPLRNLENFFNIEYDLLSEDLYSIDLSNLEISDSASSKKTFKGCKYLEYIIFPRMNTTSLTDMSSMFSGCSSLRSIDFSGFNTGSVTDMSSMFSGCSSLRSIDISGFNTGSVTDMSYMFSGCSSLIDIGSREFRLNIGHVVNMSSLFSGCIQLTGIIFDTEFSNELKDTSAMFSGCSNLDYVDFLILMVGQ